MAQSEEVLKLLRRVGGLSLEEASPVSVLPIPQSPVRSPLQRNPAFPTYDRGGGDQLLLKCGYTHLQQIGDFYLKAINANGDCVYLNIDGQGDFRNLPQVRLLPRKGSKIPQATRLRLEECLNSIGCGVIFQGKDELCALSRDNHGRLQESTYSPDVKSSEVKTFMAYPLISISEVRLDHKTSLERTRQATRTIQEILFREEMEKFNEMQKVISGLYSNMRILQGIFEEFERLRLAEVEQSPDKLIRKNLFYDSLRSQNQAITSNLDCLREVEIKTQRTIYQLFMEGRRSLDSKVAKSAVSWDLPKKIDELPQLTYENITAILEQREGLSEKEITSLEKLRQSL